MFVNNEISFVETNLQVNRPIEAQCIKIQDFFFFNVYVPPNKSVARPDLLSLLTSIKSRPNKTIIVGDFNAQYPTWGSNISNTHGRHLHYVIDLLDLVLLNTTTVTRIDMSSRATNSTRGSLLDLTIATSDIANRIETEVTDQLLGSDHFTVMSRFGTNVDPTFRPGLFQKADWEEYAKLSIEYLQATPEGTDLSVAVEEFSNVTI